MALLGRTVSRGDRRAGFTILEVLVSLTIMAVGVTAIMFLIPTFLRSGKEAELRTRAAFLAQMKAEEIRRDDTANTRDLYTAIITYVNANASAPLPGASDPVPFPLDPELSYSFSNQTALYAGQSPEGDPGVARVLISRTRVPAPTPYSQPLGLPLVARDVIYELRFAP